MPTCRKIPTETEHLPIAFTAAILTIGSAEEVILGIGGVRMLRALGYHEVCRFPMSALLTKPFQP
jgi:hypothetical protein